MNDNIKHVCVYLRLSRDEKKLGIEKVLETHRTTLLKICNERNYSYELFEEVASSNSIEGRKQFKKLLHRIKDFEYDAIVVMDLDRLSRNEYDSSDIKRILYETGTLIVTPNKIYNLNSDEDSLLMGIQSLVASQEYKQILKRMKRGKRSASRKGNWVYGFPPMGYTKNKTTKKLEPNEDAKHIKWIFQQVASGRTITQVARDLNTMGIKTSKGKQFHNNSIIRIINNENYKGTLITSRITGKHGEVKPKDEWIIVENAHPKVVSEELWNEANKKEKIYHFAQPRSKNRIYPTTGIIKCGQCGRTQGTTKYFLAGEYKWYIKGCLCKNRCFKYEPVLILIKQELFNQRDNLINEISEVKQDSNGNDTEYKKKQLEMQIQKSRGALDNIEILFEESEIDLKQYRERKAKRNNQLLMLEEELKVIEGMTIEKTMKSLNETLERFNFLCGNWKWLDNEGLEDEKVNLVLHALLEKIEWTYPKGGQPNLNFVYK